MEFIYPEIALKQPKADPRTVLLHKRNFMESSSDHIQEQLFHNEFSYQHTTTTTAKCDKLINLYKNSPTPTTATRDTTFVLTKSLASSSLLLLLQLSKSSSSLLSTILVNFSKSCHFNASLNNLYKLQKTKLLFFVLIIWCAIFLQTTQAIPVHRTSGRKLILHTNVYRERQHQKLLEERQQHNQHQQLLQIQQQQLQEIKEQQQHQLQLNQQQQQLQQVQINHIYSSTKLLRREPTQQHHRHHLHQRAAPSTVISQNKKMSYCNGNSVYQNLHKQINHSLSFITELCSNYLRDRGNDTFETMSETWKLIKLNTSNPNRKSISMDNELHKRIHEFYLNLHNFDQLIDYATKDTNDNKTKIEHGEDISIDIIIDFFKDIKQQITFNMGEADKLMEKLEIEKPDLNDNVMEFNAKIERRVRDFLIIKDLIEEFERVTKIVTDYCENDNKLEG